MIVCSKFWKWNEVSIIIIIIIIIIVIIIIIIINCSSRLFADRRLFLDSELNPSILVAHSPSYYFCCSKYTGLL